ncbi:hypothetical protein OPIT5_10945 [Opitutaceae bacterium TAV5]|nr:hypothetical protein OPIT5_10945 [Opitutaceae bacterium TAV5]
MVSIGVIFRKFNRNVGDCFRGGSQGTWWLVGMNASMLNLGAVISIPITVPTMLCLFIRRVPASARLPQPPPLPLWSRRRGLAGSGEPRGLGIMWKNAGCRATPD